MTGPPPPDHVVAAFAPGSAPVPLAGGRGSAWRAGEVVLKPADTTPEMQEWQAGILSSIPTDGFRVAPPPRAASGAFIVEGWIAAPFLAGSHEPRRWPDIIAVGRRFHEALKNVARPAFLDSRADPWSIADRVAWGDLDLGPYRRRTIVSRLEPALRPLRAPAQMIHGDLTGNVLFADPEPPAVIDLSPYWRPPAFASAIVVADALVWEGADESLLEVVDDIDDFGQFLARALLYRIVTEAIARPEGNQAFDDAHVAAIDLAIRLMRDRR